MNAVSGSHRQIGQRNAGCCLEASTHAAQKVWPSAHTVVGLQRTSEESAAVFGWHRGLGAGVFRRAVVRVSECERMVGRGGAPNMCGKAVKRGSERSHRYMRCESSGDPEGSK